MYRAVRAHARTLAGVDQHERNLTGAVLAREYGFASWTKLKAHIDSTVAFDLRVDGSAACALWKKSRKRSWNDVESKIQELELVVFAEGRLDVSNVPARLRACTN